MSSDTSKQNLFTNYILKQLETNRESIINQWNHPKDTLTKHFVIDNLLPDDWCHELYDSFPKDGNGFYNYQSFREKKKSSANLSAYAPILSDITYALQNTEVVKTISSYLGLKSIEPDPMLFAGGLSMMFKGHFLNPHLDNSHDIKRERYRRLNVLYYVSPNWKLENGGNLELWDKEKLNPKTIFAKTNRLVVMETNKESWHSVSKVNVDHPRCCISNYYFSQISPDQSDYFHVTSFTGRPEEKLLRSVSHLDNSVRNFISKIFKIGRGREDVNISKTKH